MKTLPELANATAAAAPASGRTDPSNRILVVEDDIYIRQLSAEALMLCGYQVDAAEDGAAGWEALQAKSYDLMIINNNLPKVTGLELIKKLRAAHMTLPVIMATTGKSPSQELNRRPWLPLGATLLQPYTIGELLGTVKEVLRVTESAGEQIASSPNWQSQPSAVGVQL